MRVCCLLALFAGVWSQTPPRQQVSPMLPSVALEAADAGALSLAFVVAQSGVSAGVITSANPTQPNFTQLSARLAESRTAPMADVVERFARAHPSYQIGWRGEVLDIEERDLACGHETRNRTVGPVEVSGDMSRLVVLLGWLAGGGSGPVPGGTMSRATSTTLDSAPLPSVHIASTLALSLKDGLDAVVRQSLGGAWIVWQHDRLDQRTGCRTAGYFPNGFVGASSEDFAVF